MTPPTVRIAAPAASRDRARALAARYGLPLAPAPAAFELWCDGARSVLRPVDAEGAAVSSALGRTRRGSDPLLRAVLGRGGRGKGARVVDATAGLGGDAAALAERGVRVRMIERHPALAALLEVALEALAADPGTADRASRLALSAGEAHELLPALQPPPEVILLDPMFPRRRREAGKPAAAALLRALLPEADLDAAARLLARARSVAVGKVVVKRGAKDPPLALGRSGQVAGRTVRFDLYAGHGVER